MSPFQHFAPLTQLYFPAVIHITIFCYLSPARGKCIKKENETMSLSPGRTDTGTAGIREIRIHQSKLNLGCFSPCPKHFVISRQDMVCVAQSGDKWIFDPGPGLPG